ncbi:MAG: hypothetical protein ACFFD2_08360 [Promethearchaeota archaeon]
MFSDRESLQDAINRALKAANRALKANSFDKVADIYYRIAYMLNDLGDKVSAQNFSTAAKQFKEKNQLLTEINNTRALADEAYKKKDYTAVAENYLQISSLATAFGDMYTAKKFAVEAEKFMEIAKIQGEVNEPKIKTMKEIASNIQSKIPSTIKLKKDITRSEPKNKLGYDEALVALGLICGYCGHSINPDLKKCPNCGKII